MRFGPVPVEAAEGAILAHSLRLPARKIPKGTVLSADDVRALQQAQIAEVIVARLEAGDVDENTAAAKLGVRIVSNDLRMGSATTGRVNLYATAPGLLQLNASAIHAINGKDPGLTLATLPPYAPLTAGTMVATVKVIPYAIPETSLTAALPFAENALQVLPPQIKQVTLIETRLSEGPLSEKGRRVTAARLEPFGASLTPRSVVAHEIADLAQAIQEAPGELILILTGSATSDEHDTAPAALTKAGGTLTHYGMPVDPGNLLFLGAYKNRPVIGLPGCARSPAINGADWVLQRVLCGVDVTSADITQMGVGGLLKEMPSRPRPRDSESVSE